MQSHNGHAATAWAWYFLMAMGIMLALWALGVAALHQWLVVVAWAVVLVVAGLYIDRHWQRHLSRSGQS
ncbi:hypothetical protein AAGS40_03050 [Paraburkholderia sp. PREW-6R]|uniref:hypothetical protein n=1 Tax=Paraburkholderia sp. PREW-6R TaxID=3141544 RepID=UPI0031F4FB6B